MTSGLHAIEKKNNPAFDGAAAIGPDLAERVLQVEKLPRFARRDAGPLALGQILGDGSEGEHEVADVGLAIERSAEVAGAKESAAGERIVVFLPREVVDPVALGPAHRLPDAAQPLGHGEAVRPSAPQLGDNQILHRGVQAGARVGFRVRTWRRLRGGNGRTGVVGHAPSYQRPRSVNTDRVSQRRQGPVPLCLAGGQGALVSVDLGVHCQDQGA